MANLVFTGHEIRGKELRKLLENLGGIDAGYVPQCSFVTCYYYINREGFIECSNAIPLYMEKRVIMTLEEFEQKYPYKVGDKVNYIKYNDGYPSVYTIQRMRWTGRTVEYLLDSNGFSALAKDLQPYKEEIVDTGCCSMPTIPPSYKLSIKQLEEMKQTIVFSNDSPDEIELVLGDNYEVKVKEGKTYVVKKQPKYPKTYEDCCKVLLLNPERATYSVCGLEYKRHLMVNFQRLLVCRDAYWKIAGDWKPDFTNYEEKFVITYLYGKVYSTVSTNYNRVLVFPTEEMRDAFYENFNELIEECKELL